MLTPLLTFCLRAQVLLTRISMHIMSYAGAYSGLRTTVLLTPTLTRSYKGPLTQNEHKGLERLKWFETKLERPD